MMSICRRVSILALLVPESMVFFLLGFWLNPLNKVCGSHRLKILSNFIIRHETH